MKIVVEKLSDDIEYSRESHLVNLGHAVARMEYVQGWLVDGKVKEYGYPGTPGPRNTMKLESVTFMSPGYMDGGPAQSIVSHDIKGLMRLRDALNHWLPGADEPPVAVLNPELLAVNILTQLMESLESSIWGTYHKESLVELKKQRETLYKTVYTALIDNLPAPQD